MKLFVSYHLVYSYKIGDQKYIESEFKSMILEDKDEPWEQETLEQLEIDICEIEKELTGFDTGAVKLINFKSK